MAFYDLNKEERQTLVAHITAHIAEDTASGKLSRTLAFFADEDTYIRKTAYLAVGRIYLNKPELQQKILNFLTIFAREADFKVRQTAVNAAGEIGKKDFGTVRRFFDEGLFDEHHSVRNAVIGSMKKIGEVNPEPLLAWATTYLDHPDKEIRREICHGIELRGRTHPQDILPLLKTLQWDKQARVYKTLVHVIGQIAYKKGCLETVVADLRQWENQKLALEVLEEIVDVHHRYRNFSFYTQEQARKYIEAHY